MHLNVIDEVQQGIMMMKYTVNHPYMFVPIKSESKDGDDKSNKSEEPILSDEGMMRRVIMVFALGFFQATVGIIVEILIIYYLSTLDKFINIICKYVAFAALTKFDNFYSKCIHDHGIFTAQRKNLRFHHRRYMMFKKEEEVDEL